MGRNLTEGRELGSQQQFALSPGQERLWVLEQLHPSNPVHNVALALQLPLAFDVALLERAWDEVVEQHEILRTQFQIIDGMPVEVSAASTKIPVRHVEVQNLAESERAARFSSLVEQEMAMPFDLTHGFPVRATLFRRSEGEHVFLLVTHRIVCDEISLRILLSEICSRYQVRSNSARPREAGPQYRRLVSRKDKAPELSYWLQQLAAAPSTLDLPTDRPRPPVQTFRGSRQQMRIDPLLEERLRDLAQKQGARVWVVLLAAFDVLLSRYARQEDLVVGLRVSGRHRPELERVVGPLENMLALRTNLSGDPSFADLLARVRELVEGAFDHQEVPFETLIRELHLERDMSRHPLFQVMFTMPEAIEFDLGLGAKLLEPKNATEPFDLAIEFVPQENELTVTFSYNTDVFDDSTIARMIRHFRILLDSVAQNPHLKISRIPLLEESERHQLLVDWNNTSVPYPRDVPLHKLIEAQVEKTPDSVAVVYGSESLTYRQVNGRSNQLAGWLRKNGVGPDVLVAVCAERSIELVIALLATLKSGGAYVPLDPEYPKDRLEMILRDAAPPVVLTQAYLLDRLPAESGSIFCLERDWPSLQSESTENPSANVGGKHLAYAIYTSGSTGKPKGVLNVHEGIVNRLLWMQDMYQLSGQDRVLQKTPFSFDVSVWEFFWPLLTGATLVVARPGGHRDCAYLVNLIAQQGITTLHFVPSMLGIFLESAGLERCRSLRQVFVSGEALPFELQQRFFGRLQAELHNLYGPTEASVDVTYWACRPHRQPTIVPIGRPIANTEIYILDANLEPVPIGVPGELHIGGIGLARGYLNRPALTEEKFIPNPFRNEPCARLYKTGDLARFHPDGNIEYLGRIDLQVKLRGFRIELGEIEAVLGECAGVLQAVVVLREDNPGDKSLVAYVMAEPGKTLEIEDLQREIKQKLPEYMLPSRFVFVERFPMTTSGKVDRKALPSPPVTRGAAITWVAPRNLLESRLASLFARILGLPSVGVRDNFFDLGGHSLLAGRLLAQLNQEMGTQIPLSALFQCATVESLASLLAEPSEVRPEPVVVEIQHGDTARLPFFAIVPPGEQSLGYAMLARHMGRDQMVYKIQGQAPITGGKRPYSEQEMRALTDEYTAAMRGVQPRGPYCLGGLCDGAHIAEQIVLSLESQGEEIGLFAIFDTWVLQHSQRRWLWKAYYYSQRVRALKQLSLSQQLASYRHVVKNKVQHLVGTKLARTDWQQAYWPEDFSPPRFRAPVVLFKRPRQPFYYIDDPEMGWGARSQSGVEIHVVDFRHMEILREPHVRTFGEKLAERMARIEHESGVANFAPGVSRLTAAMQPAE